MRRLARIKTIERALARSRDLAFRVPPWTVGLLGTASAFARDATTASAHDSAGSDEGARGDGDGKLDAANGTRAMTRAEKVKDAIRRAKEAAKYAAWSAETTSLVVACWAPQASERPDFTEVLTRVSGMLESAELKVQVQADVLASKANAQVEKKKAQKAAAVLRQLL